MLRKAILVYKEDTCRIKCEVVRLVEGNTLWRTIDIHTLHRTVTLHDAFASSVVSITTRLAIIREYHQAVVFIPVHLTGSVRRVVRYQSRITVGIMRVIFFKNLFIKAITSFYNVITVKE